MERGARYQGESKAHKEKKLLIGLTSKKFGKFVDSFC
jgi:hypothetical protein